MKIATNCKEMRDIAGVGGYHIMKVLKRAKTPNGTGIQIEDWREDYSFIEILGIGAYPIARESRGNWIRKNETFRLSITDNFNNDDEVYSIFNKLIDGSITLKELSKNFRDSKDINLL